MSSKVYRLLIRVVPRRTDWFSFQSRGILRADVFVKPERLVDSIPYVHKVVDSEFIIAAAGHVPPVFDINLTRGNYLRRTTRPMETMQTKTIATATAAPTLANLITAAASTSMGLGPSSTKLEMALAC